MVLKSRLSKSVSKVSFEQKFHQAKKICAENGPREAAPEGAATLGAPDFMVQAPAFHFPPEDHGALGG